MKRITLWFCLMMVAIVYGGRPLLASSPERSLEKVHYTKYTGPQRDWPRSAESATMVKTVNGMSILEKLPSRPYQLLGTMTDEGDHAIKHVAQAARLIEADAILVVGDKAFSDAGVPISPQLLENADIPDPRGPRTVTRLDHPEALKTRNEAATIRVTRIAAIVIRWTTK